MIILQICPVLWFSVCLSFLFSLLNVGVYTAYKNPMNKTAVSAPIAVPSVLPAAPYAATSGNEANAFIIPYPAAILTIALTICSSICDTAVGIIVLCP